MSLQAGVTAGAALIGGAVAGSAAGVMLQRWPAGETLQEPVRSRCAACGVTLRAHDLVPVISWIRLRGRCATCSARIDRRLPLLEVVSAVGVTGVTLVHGAGTEALLLAIGVVAVLLAALLDLEHRRIPDRLTLPLAAVALPSVALVTGPTRASLALLVWSVVLPSGLLLLSAMAVRFGHERPIGGGDSKLLVGILALAALVPSGPVLVLVVAILSAGTVAAIGLATRRLQRGDRLPFAPAIAVGYLAVVLLPTSRLGALVGAVGAP